jgi:hypothetical protein
MKAILLLAVVFSSLTTFAVTFDQDVPAAIQKQFVEDLNVAQMAQGSSQTPLHKEIYGAVDGKTYQKFFEERITMVGLDACGGGDSVVACVQPFAGVHTMWLTENFVKFKMPQVARMMVIFHEARHTEAKNRFWSHDTCPTPFLDENGKDIRGLFSGVKLEGQDACDSTPYGSYGSSTIMMKNLAKYCTNCSEKTKMDADMMANDQINRIDVASVKQQMKDDFNK